MLGLPWAFFGPLPGLSWDPFWASGGPFWGSWRPLGLQGLLGLSRAAPGQPLGRSWGTLGAPWGHSWRLLGLSWPALGLLPASLGPSWRLLGPPLGRLGRLLAAESEFSRNPVKTVVLAWFWHGFWASGGPPGGSWRPLGGLWAALGALLGALGVSGAVPGWPGRRLDRPSGSESGSGAGRKPPRPARLMSPQVKKSLTRPVID